MNDFTNQELDNYWKEIEDGEFDHYPEESRPIIIGSDILSIPVAVNGGTARRVFTRMSSGEWEEAPYMWEKRDFEDRP